MSARKIRVGAWVLRHYVLRPSRCLLQTHSLRLRDAITPPQDPLITFVLTAHPPTPHAPPKDDSPRTVSIHRSLLRAAGGPLAALVTSPFVESEMSHIVIHETFECFDVVRKFLYCEPIHMLDLPRDLPLVADRWGLTSLFEACFIHAEERAHAHAEHPQLSVAELIMTYVPIMSIVDVPDRFKTYLALRFGIEIKSVDAYFKKHPVTPKSVDDICCVQHDDSVTCRRRRATICAGKGQRPCTTIENVTAQSASVKPLSELAEGDERDDTATSEKEENPEENKEETPKEDGDVSFPDKSSSSVTPSAASTSLDSKTEESKDTSIVMEEPETPSKNPSSPTSSPTEPREPSTAVETSNGASCEPLTSAYPTDVTENTESSNTGGAEAEDANVDVTRVDSAGPSNADGTGTAAGRTKGYVVVESGTRHHVGYTETIVTSYNEETGASISGCAIQETPPESNGCMESQRQPQGHPGDVSVAVSRDVDSSTTDGNADVVIAAEEASPSAEVIPSEVANYTDEATNSVETNPTEAASPAEEANHTENANPGESASNNEDASLTEQVNPAEESSPTEEAGPIHEAVPSSEAGPPLEISATEEADDGEGSVQTGEYLPGSVGSAEELFDSDMLDTNSSAREGSEASSDDASKVIEGEDEVEEEDEEEKEDLATSPAPQRADWHENFNIWEVFQKRGMLDEAIHYLSHYGPDDYTPLILDVVLRILEPKLSDDEIMRLLREIDWDWENPSCQTLNSKSAETWSARAWRLLASARVGFLGSGSDIRMCWIYSDLYFDMHTRATELTERSNNESESDSSHSSVEEDVDFVQDWQGKAGDEHFEFSMALQCDCMAMDHLSTLNLRIRLIEKDDAPLDKQIGRREVSTRIKIIESGCGCDLPARQNERSYQGFTASPLKDMGSRTSLWSFKEDGVKFKVMSSEDLGAWMKRHRKQCGLVFQVRVFVYPLDDEEEEKKKSARRGDPPKADCTCGYCECDACSSDEMQ